MLTPFVAQVRIFVFVTNKTTIQGVSENCSTFDKILKNKDNMNKLMER